MYVWGSKAIIVVVLIIGGVQEDRVRRRVRECAMSMLVTISTKKTENPQQTANPIPVILVQQYPFRGFRDSEIMHATQRQFVIV